MKKELFKEEKPLIIGMIHLPALPGTAGFKGNMKEVIDRAIYDAKVLKESGIDALIVENFGDMPYKIELDLAQSTALASAAALVKAAVGLPIGIDAAMNDYKSALSCAKAAGADFIRIPVFVDTVEYFGGIITPCATKALEYRKQIQAEEVAIFADIQVKHTHMLIPNIPIEESAAVAESCGADALIVTGSHTGGEAPIEMVKRAKNTVKIPVLVGSGISTYNIKDQMSIADGAIVGSSLKEGNSINNPVDGEKCRKLLGALRG